MDAVHRWTSILGGLWAISSAIVNIIFWFHTPQEWVNWAEANPRYAPIVRLSRAWGFDPIRGLYAFRDLFANRHGPSARLTPIPPVVVPVLPPGALPATPAATPPASDSLAGVSPVTGAPVAPTSTKQEPPV